jgi:hypothetical protein
MAQGDGQRGNGRDEQHAQGTEPLYRSRQSQASDGWKKRG